MATLKNQVTWVVAIPAHLIKTIRLKFANLLRTKPQRQRPLRLERWLNLEEMGKVFINNKQQAATNIRLTLQ